MALEIERKYLAKIVGDLAPKRTRIIESGYLSALDPEVRIARYRGVPGSYQITTKKGKGLQRTEIVVDVDDEQGLALFNMTDQKVAKVRDDIQTLIPGRTRYDNGTPGLWEVDTYLGKLQGLVVAEIELPGASAVVPGPPEGVVLLKEVTEDARFKNKALATASEAEIAALLKEYRVEAGLETVPQDAEEVDFDSLVKTGELLPCGCDPVQDGGCICYTR